MTLTIKRGAKGEKPWAKYTIADGTITIDDKVVGKFDLDTSEVYRGDKVIGRMQKSQGLFRDVFNANNDCVASFVVNKQRNTYDGATVRPYGNPYSCEFLQSGEVMANGQTVGFIYAGEKDIEDYFVPLGAIFIFWIEKFVLESLETQKPMKDEPAPGTFVVSKFSILIAKIILTHVVY